MEMVMKLISYLSGKVKNFDKYLHLLIGTLVYVVTTTNFNVLIGLCATAVVARWKEIYDKEHPDKHTYDGWDAYATLLGVVVGEALLNSPIKLYVIELANRFI